MSVKLNPPYTIEILDSQGNVKYTRTVNDIEITEGVDTSLVGYSLPIANMDISLVHIRATCLPRYKTEWVCSNCSMTCYGDRCHSCNCEIGNYAMGGML